MAEKISPNSLVIHQMNVKMTSDINSLQAEQEHALDHAAPENRNYDPEKSHENIILEHNPDFPYLGENQKDLERERLEQNPDCKYTSEWKTADIIKDKLQTMKDEGLLKGRCNFRNDERGSICYQSEVISLSKETYEKLTPDQVVDYLKDSYQFLKEEAFKDREIIDARIHRDEQGQTHLQVKSIPLHQEPDGRYTLSTKAYDREHVIKDCERRGVEPPRAKDGSIATKYAYTSLQNNFYEYHKDKFRDREIDIVRNHKTRDRLEDREYKELQDEKRDIEKQIEKLQERQQEIEKSLKDKEEQQRQIEQDRQKLEKEKKEHEEQIKDRVENINKQIKSITKGLNDREKDLEARESDLNQEKDRTVEIGEQARNDFRNATLNLKQLQQPEPDGKGLHKGFFSKDQMEKIINSVNSYITTLRDQGLKMYHSTYELVDDRDKTITQLEHQRDLYKQHAEAREKENRELKEKNHTLERENKRSNRVIDKLKSIPFIRDNVLKAEKQVERDMEREREQERERQEHKHDRNEPSHGGR